MPRYVCDTLQHSPHHDRCTDPDAPTKTLPVHTRTSLSYPLAFPPSSGQTDVALSVSVQCSCSRYSVLRAVTNIHGSQPAGCSRHKHSDPPRLGHCPRRTLLTSDTPWQLLLCKACPTLPHEVRAGVCFPPQGLAFVGISESTVTKSHLNASEVMTENSGSSTLFMSETGAVLAAALDTHRNLGAFPVTATASATFLTACILGSSNHRKMIILASLYF